MFSWWISSPFWPFCPVIIFGRSVRGSTGQNILQKTDCSYNLSYILTCAISCYYTLQWLHLVQAVDLIMSFGTWNREYCRLCPKRSHCCGLLMSLGHHSPMLLWGHFYVSMKGHAILGPPLGHHKLSNIYASPLEVVWWRTVEPLQSNGQKNVCCRRGEPLPNAEWLPNSDPALSKRELIFWG